MCRCPTLTCIGHLTHLQPKVLVLHKVKVNPSQLNWIVHINTLSKATTRGFLENLNSLNITRRELKQKYLSTASAFFLISATKSTGLAYFGSESCCCFFSLSQFSASTHSFKTYEHVKTNTQLQNKLQPFYGKGEKN